jgi:Phage integrase family
MRIGRTTLVGALLGVLVLGTPGVANARTVHVTGTITETSGGTCGQPVWISPLVVTIRCVGLEETWEGGIAGIGVFDEARSLNLASGELSVSGTETFEGCVGASCGSLEWAFRGSGKLDVETFSHLFIDGSQNNWWLRRPSERAGCDSVLPRRRWSCDIRGLLGRRLLISESLAEVGGELTFGSTKSHAERVVPLTASVAAALEAHLDDRVRSDPRALVFMSPKGHALRYANFRREVWAPALRAAKVPKVGLHVLRHSAASAMIRAGASPKALQRSSDTSPRASRSRSTGTCSSRTWRRSRGGRRR